MGLKYLDFVKIDNKIIIIYFKNYVIHAIQVYFLYNRKVLLMLKNYLIKNDNFLVNLMIYKLYQYNISNKKLLNK
jgi:hypothetical protein